MITAGVFNCPVDTKPSHQKVLIIQMRGFCGFEMCENFEENKQKFEFVIIF